MKLFVYGTLKRGFGNNRLLRDAKFLGNARTVQPFVLLDSGFPVMTPVGAGNMRVSGEVYEIDNIDNSKTLARLDALEGEGRMYDRVKIDVVTDDLREIKVHAYIGCADAFSHFSLGLRWLDRDGLFTYGSRVSREADTEETTP
jgi:gamma-glutamylaminecyclotransferase